MSQVINNNKENGRVPFANIKNQQNQQQSSNQQLKKPQQPSIVQLPQQQQQSRYSIQKDQNTIEILTRKLRDAEDQLKIERNSNATLKLENELLTCSLVGEKEKSVTKVNNNRVRKIQNLTIENQNLKERIEQIQLEHNNSDKVSQSQTNHRIRLIQRLRSENEELRNNINNNNNNVNTIVSETTTTATTNGVTTPPISSTITPIRQHRHQHRHIHPITQSSYDSFNYSGGIDEHPGEC